MSERSKILQGDVREALKTLADGSVNCCVTSPPYWGLRDYGVDGQLGLEKTPEEYVAHMVEVFREVRRVLKDDGTLWLNLGDSYASAWAAGRRNIVGQGSRSGRRVQMGDGLKEKDLVGIPWRVAFALQADGWYLRQDIIWAKPNPMPESVTDRCTKSHEYVFLLSKSPRYYFDNESVWEPAAQSSVKRIEYGLHHRHPDGVGVGIPPVETGKMGKRFLRWKEPSVSEGSVHVHMVTGAWRNRRDVWFVPTQSYRGAHFATFPEKLVEPCILAGSPKGGVVLDPFFGSGTTGAVAKRLGRDYMGIELNPEYIKLAEQRIAAVPTPLL